MLIGCPLFGCTAIGDVDAFTDQPSGGTAGPEGGVAGRCEGGVCPPGQEDCTNAVDDNDDGLADCADPLCQDFGYACVPLAPIGWDGPAVLYQGGSAAACSGAYDVTLVDGGRGLSAEPAVCSACTCGNASGSCPAASVQLFRAEDGECSSGCGAQVELPPGTCVDLKPIGMPCHEDDQRYAVNASSVGVFSGSCTPSAQTPTLPPPVWLSPYVLCGTPAGGGCGPASVCAPPASPAATSGLCVGTSGDAACPEGFPLRELVHRSIDDQRACTECNCAPATCTGTIDLFDGGQCNDGHVKASLPSEYAGTCVDFSKDKPRARFTVDEAPKCSATPATPVGQAIEVDPYTVCCAP